MQATPARLACLMVLSGCASLVLEVLWLRGFALVLGSTLQAMSCVLTAFLLGLAGGSGLMGLLLRRRPAWLEGRTLRLYGALELFVGLYGVAFTLLLFGRSEALIGLVSGWGTGAAPQTVLAHFLLCTGGLLLPTMAMGATLPLISHRLRRDGDVARLYAWNTFGAAVGSLASTFLLIWAFGCYGAALVVLGLDVLLACACLLLREPETQPEPQPRTPPELAPEMQPALAPAAGADAPLDGLALGLLAAFSGYAFFAFELAWTRVLGLLLGNRIYVTSVVLALVLACLTIGALLVPGLSRAGRSPRRLLARSYALAVLGTGLALFLVPAALYGETPLAARLLFVVWLVLVPACAMALAFPLLLALPRAGDPTDGRGAHVGRIYALNTLGSVAGSLLTGYVALPLLGSARVLVLNGGLLLACAALVGSRVGSGVGGGVGAPRRSGAGLLGLGALAALLALQWGARISPVDPAAAVVLEEDAQGIFSIAPVGTQGRLSDRCDATELVYHYGAPQTSWVQESQAHLPLVFAAGCERALVLGSGYGITAGAFGAWPEVTRVDAVEIVQAMVDHAARFSPLNHDYQRNPRVAVWVADGRHFLATREDPYDVISINVSDPYLPGSSSLFSREFYQLVERRLAPGGVVCQHFFGADTPSLLHAFRRHFPHLRAVPGYRNSITVIGGREPLTLQRVAALRANPAARAAFAAGGHDVDQLEEVLRRGDELLAAALAEPAEFENSDVHPDLELRRGEGVGLLFSNQ